MKSSIYLHLDRPVRGRESLNNVWLGGCQVVVDSPGGAQAGTAAGAGSVTDLKGEDVAAHVIVKRLGENVSRGTSYTMG